MALVYAARVKSDLASLGPRSKDFRPYPHPLISTYGQTMPQQPLAQVPKDASWYWSDNGSCREADPLLFFHPQNERGSARGRRERSAKLICMQCTVRIECADYAVRAREPYGVWGGLSEDDRERIYSRLDIRKYPRGRGEGAQAAAAEIAQAVSPQALGLVK